ncbi:MAG TPA: TIGR03435 family protein, partial [Candidatus Acidoferrales bacterium]|nr:TIGR03435 family protein [Candidatus Acidoferrales bacterium]
MLRAAGLTALAVSIAFGLVDATSGLAQSKNQSPAQNAAPTAPSYQFEVATIKPSPRTDSGGVAGFLTEDSFQAKNYSIRAVLLYAYGMWAGRDETVLGGPKWLDTERYYIDAKMDPLVADKLKKLSPDQRELAQRQMVQALLADRLKLVIHRETRELPIYSLLIAKGGPKLKESTPGDTYEKAFPYADKFADAVKPGAIFGVGGGGSQGHAGTMTEYCFGVSTFGLARQLTF